MNQMKEQQIEEVINKIAIDANEELYQRFMRNIDYCVKSCKKYDVPEIHAIYLASMNTAIELGRVILTETLIKLFCDESA